MLYSIDAAAARAIDGWQKARLGCVQTADDMSDTHDADYDEHAKMWSVFTRLMAAGVAGAVAVLIFMAVALL